MIRTTRMILIGGLLLAGLSACGKKGNLENPPLTSDQKGPDGKPVPPAQYRPFILDPLLRS
jgi:predicted small lipoprotein YifL